MNKTVLIVIGVILLLVFVLLLSVVFPKVKEGISRIPLRVYLLVLLIVLVALVFVGIQLFAPKGSDSLLSKEVIGEEQGDQESSAAPEAQTAEAYLGSVGDFGPVEIRIHVDEIWFGSTQLSEKELAAVLDSHQKDLEGRTVYLIDDYALYKTWNEVKTILKEREIHPREK